MTIAKNITLSSRTDQVSKALLELSDGNAIETVLIKNRSRYTACISSQVGCPLYCAFCATGLSGFTRDLTAEEIVEQVVFWNKSLAKEKKRVNNIVFMGMGEPFLNWDNVKEALKRINSPGGLNTGQRHISLSTCGLIDRIKDFSREKTQINLAVSLHSALNQTRSRLMPVNKKHSLAKLIPACLEYVQKTKRKLFFEYTLLQGVNDTNKEIVAVAKLIQKHYLFHLNIIPYNATDTDFKPTGKKRLKQITAYLDHKKVSYTVRKSVGSDINAACGQLISNPPSPTIATP